MQDIIVEKPYRFIPPHRGNWVPNLIQRFRLVDRYLSYFEGIESYEVRNADRLRASLQQDAGILLAPNHCRYADPLAIGWIAREVGIHVYAMASWHLFHQSRLQAFAIRMCGGFSVYREGLDRKSMDTAIGTLTDGERPLVLFPEGTVFRTNDRLQPLLEGVSFIARNAARKRAKAGHGPVVIHPVAIKYLFRGELTGTLEPIVHSLERQLNWSDIPESVRASFKPTAADIGSLVRRVKRLEEAFFSLREIQFLGAASRGELSQRKETLIGSILSPLEEQILGRTAEGSVLSRIKQLRTQLVPRLISESLTPAERGRVWEQLADIYVAQQVESYPEGYMDNPTDMRLMETVERLEEDLKDHSTIHRPLHAILDVGEAIEVGQERAPKGQPDPLLEELSDKLGEMISALAGEARLLDAQRS